MWRICLIYQSSTHMYTRISNPTVAALEEKMALLEGGVAAVAAASGPKRHDGLPAGAVPGGGPYSGKQQFVRRHQQFGGRKL